MTFQRQRKEKCLSKGEIFKIRVVSVAASVNKGCHFTNVTVTPNKPVTESRTDLSVKMQTFFR